MESGGGALGLAAVLAAHSLPGAVLAPVAGAIVDRFDRRRVLVVADSAAALITLGMAAAAALGWLATLQLLLLMRSGVVALVPPGESAAVRHVVGADDLVPANAILAGTWSVAYVSGMALGGLLATIGPTFALALDAVTFALAAGVHAMLPRIPVAPGRSATPWAVLRAVPGDMRTALVHAAAYRPLLAAVLGKVPVALAAGAGWIALNWIGVTARPFGAAALSFGVLQAVRGVGTGVGPAAAAWLVQRGVSEAHLRMAAYGATLTAIAALSVVREPIWLLTASFIWGLGSGTNWVLVHAALQRHATDAIIGRLAAVDELMVSFGMVASAWVGAYAIGAGGIRAAAVVGVLLGLVGWMGSVLWVRLIGSPDPEQSLS